MIYYIIGLLLIAALRLVFYLKRCEYEIKQSGAHEFLVIIFSVYLLGLFIFLKSHVFSYGVEELNLVYYFLPLGFFMPMLFRRFRFLLINLVTVAAANLFLCFLQLYICGHTNYANIIFALFGVLIGFILYAIFREFIPGIRNGFLVEKKKKKPLTVTFEAELTIFAIIIMIGAGAAAGNILGGDKQIKVKGEASREPASSYEEIYYAHRENYDRYDKYAAKNPGMKLEDIVWRVEANLDQEFYDEDFTNIADQNTNDPFLINKFNRVSDDFEPKNLVNIEGDYVATPETARAYKKMLNDMKKEGMTIYVVSSYRSVSYQENLYNYYLRTDTREKVDTYSARPGYSEHHTGRALDISQVYNNLDVFEGSDEAEWVYKNAYKYGFIVRYTEDNMDATGYIFEPWHITYVGQDVSQKMHDEEIKNLEEYVVKYMDNTP